MELSRSEPNGLLGEVSFPQWNCPGHKAEWPAGRFPFLCFRTDTGIWILKPWAGYHHKGNGLLEKPLSTQVHQSSQGTAELLRVTLSVYHNYKEDYLDMATGPLYKRMVFRRQRRKTWFSEITTETYVGTFTIQAEPLGYLSRFIPA